MRRELSDSTDPAINTHRERVLKFEMPRNEPLKQLQLVSSKLYHFQDFPEELADNSNIWHTTDALYSSAKQAYDGITEPFLQKPNIYKLKPVSKRQQQHDNTTTIFSSSIQERDPFEGIPVSELDREINTQINPFLPPAPWIYKKDFNGEYVYYNTVTKQKKKQQPEEIWQKKLDMLSKLSLKKNLSGWEYTEDDTEKRKRFRVIAEFQKNLQKEVDRRHENPNDREQVEDALRDMVEYVARHEEHRMRKIILKEKEITRKYWHPVTRGYEMHKLELIGGGTGSLEKVLLTDFEYLNFLITPIGAVLPCPALDSDNNNMLTRRRSSFFNSLPAVGLSINNSYIPNVNQAFEKLQQNTKFIINNMPLVKSLKQNKHINQSLKLASAGYRGVKQLLLLKLGKQKNPEQEELDKLLQEYDNNPNKFEDDAPVVDTSTNKHVQMDTSTLSHTSMRKRLREKALNNKAANPEIPPPIPHPIDAVEITFTLTIPAPPLYVKRLPPPKKEPPQQVLLNAIPLLASKTKKNKNAIMANDPSFPKQSNKNNKIQSIPFQNKSKKMIQNSNHKNQIISDGDDSNDEEVDSDVQTNSIKHKKNSSSKNKKKKKRNKIYSEQDDKASNNSDNDNDDGNNSDDDGPSSPNNKKDKKKFKSKKFSQDDSFPGPSSLSKHSTLQSNYNAVDITVKQDQKENVEEEPIKEIFDQSERLAFESTLLQEIADACCMPARLLTIQEVIPISNTNSELLKKWKKKEQLQEFEKEKKEAERRKLLEDEAALKIKINLTQNWLSKRRKKQEDEDNNNNNNNIKNNNIKDTPAVINATNNKENNIDDDDVEDDKEGTKLPSQELFALATGGGAPNNNSNNNISNNNTTTPKNKKKSAMAKKSIPELNSNNISTFDERAGDVIATDVDNNELMEIDKGDKVKNEDSIILPKNDLPADNWLDSNIRNINEKDRLANRIVRIKRIIATEKLKKEKPVLQKLNLEDPAAEFALEKAIQFGVYSYKASEACYQYALKGEKYLSNKLPTSLIPKKKEMRLEEKKEEVVVVDPSVNGGCKIVVTLIIDNSYRSREAGAGVLENITALDMATFLQQQILHIDTDIDAGNISKYIVDINYRSCFTRREFDCWEDYWSHFITPVFFGYSSRHHKKDRNIGIPKEPVDPVVEVLPTGVHFDNPVKLMAPPAKEAFIALGGGSPMKTSILRRGEKPPLIDINASLGVEAGSYGSTKPKLYRPDMKNITLESLQRVKDVYKATKDIYDAEMRTGLVDGERLKVSQYEALQEMQEALRIFKNTARKFHKDQRLAEHGHHTQDPSNTTEWTSEMYSEWLAEAEEEDYVQLHEARRKAEITKKVRRKEVELRRRDDKQSAWMYGHLLAANTLIKDLDEALQSELDAEERRILEDKLIVKRGMSHRRGAVGILGENTEDRLKILSSKSTSSSFNLDMMGKAETAVAKALEVKKAKKDPDEAMIKILNREIMFKSLVASEERHTKALFEGACNFIMKSGRKFDREVTSLEGRTRADSSTNEPVLVYESELGIPCIKRNTFIEYLEAGRSRLAWERAKQKKLEKAAKGGETGGKRVRVRELRGDPSYLQEEDLVPMQNLRWLQVIWAKPEFEACLRGFPSSLRDIGFITGLELVQFARLVASVEPIFSRAKKAARRLKPNRKRTDSRVLKSQDSDSHLVEVDDITRKPVISMDVARTLALEVEKRIAAAATRASLREKQLASSHQHVFVEEPGGLTPFCALCLEQSEEFRWKKIDKAESEYADSVPARIDAYLQSREPIFRKKIEAHHLHRIETDVRNKRLMKIMHQDSNASSVLVVINNIITQIETTQNQIETKKKESVQQRSLTNTTTIIKGDMKRPSLPIPTSLPKYLLMTGLSAIGPTGLSVLPPELHDDDELSETEEEKAAAEKGGKPMLKRRSTMFNNQCEIQIRVWNREYGDRGDFLGRIIIGSDELLNPPKGMRAYPLIPDPNPELKRIGRKTKIVIRGSLFVRISVLRYENTAGVNMNERTPIAWGLQICNATQIACLDPVYKSSPCCEVLWRGMTYMKDKEILQTSLVELGETSVKPETIDPFWDKDDSAYFELPPLWTDYNIPNRGVRGKPLRGGWVAQNKVPLEDIKLIAITEKNKQGSQLAYNRKGSALGQLRRVSTLNKHSSGGSKTSPARGGTLRQTSIDSLGTESLGAFSAYFVETPGSSFMVQQQSVSHNGESYSKLWKAAAATVRAAIAFQKQQLPTVQDELTDRLKALQLTLEAAELERQCMAREDRRMLVNNLTIRLDLLRIQMEKQRAYAKEFSQLQQHIEQPPRIVERVCFLMASPLQAGGMKVLCEDPASKKKLDLMLLPMLYPDDEEELKRHVMPLLSRLHCSLMKVESFSVHQVRHFAMSGSPAIDQRIAAVVLESNRIGDSTYIPITIYMKRLRTFGEDLQDEDLRNALIQMSGALSALHKVGFVHRNIHVDCLAVRADLPNDHIGNDDVSLSSIAGSVSPLVSLNSFSLNSRGAKKSKIQVRLGDYWCFQNPRRIGCEYSMGRGDWGSPLTAPPEALGHGSMVCDRSDVWAMGICAYYWATGGHYPDAGLLHRLHNGGVEHLRARIPLNWGSWLSSLLIMCLQRQPSCRASADHIRDFLSKVNVRSKGRISNI